MPTLSKTICRCGHKDTEHEEWKGECTDPNCRCPNFRHTGESSPMTRPGSSGGRDSKYWEKHYHRMTKIAEAWQNAAQEIADRFNGARHTLEQVSNCETMCDACSSCEEKVDEFLEEYEEINNVNDIWEEPDDD